MPSAGDDTPSAIHTEHVVGRIAGLLAEHGHLDSFTLERLGHVAASAFVTRALGELEREEASSALHEVLAELYIRGRLDAAFRVVSRLEPDSWALRIASPYVKTAVALIRAGHVSDPDPLEDFILSIQKLAAANGPRVDLLPVAERCIGLVPEIWESVPQPLLESAALEVVRVLCASGESERTIDLDLVWADNGVRFSSDFRVQLEAVRSERLGTYDAFQGRLRTLRKQLGILEGSAALIVTRLDIVKEMAFIYWYIGDFERAKIYDERALLESEKSLGRFHQDTFDAATNYVVSLLNVEKDAEASEVARVWYERLLSQGGVHSKAWQLRLKRYAYVEATSLTEAEKVQRREGILTEMLMHLGTGAREYIRCLYSQGLALIAADAHRGYSLIADARRYAETNLGEMDHDTLSMRVPQMLGVLYADPLAAVDEYMSFYWKIACELGPSHPQVKQLREAAVKANVWTETLKHRSLGP